MTAIRHLDDLNRQKSSTVRCASEVRKPLGKIWSVRFILKANDSKYEQDKVSNDEQTLLYDAEMGGSDTIGHK